MWEVYTNFILHAINITLLFVCFSKIAIPHRLIGITILITCLIEIYAAKLKFEKQNNLFIYHTFAVFHYFAFSLFYYQLIKNKFVKRFILVTLPLFLLLAVINTIYFQSLVTYNSHTLVVKHFLIAIWIMLYLMGLFLQPGNQAIQYEPYFWISSGLLLFSLGNFFIEGMMEYLISKSHSVALRFYLAGVTLSYIFYLSIAISYLLVLVKAKRKIF